MKKIIEKIKKRFKIRCFYAGNYSNHGYKCYNKHKNIKLNRKVCKDPYNKKCECYRPR